MPLSPSELQMQPSAVASIPTGNVMKAGQQNTYASTDRQMALIGGRTKKNKRGYKYKSSKRKRNAKRNAKRQRGGDGNGNIKPQTFPSTYPIPPDGSSPNQNSAEITKLYAKTAANSEFDSQVGKQQLGGKRRKSLKKRYFVKKTFRRKKGGRHIQWGCWS